MDMRVSAANAPAAVAKVGGRFIPSALAVFRLMTNSNLVAFMAATSQAQAETTKATQPATLDHAKQNSDRAYYRGRKPSFTRAQFVKVRAMLGQQAVGIAQIAKESGLTRQTVYRIKDDPAGAEAALVVWDM